MKKQQGTDTNRTETIIKVIGWIATITAILMYVSYIPQIISNLNGDKANPIQPLVAAINCSLWVIYGFFGKPKNWPIICANFPGVIFGIFTFATSL